MVTHNRRRQSSVPLGVLALAALLLLSGCSLFSGSRPDTLPPAGKLYEDGQSQLDRGRYDAARDAFRKIIERHPDSDLVPQARFLLGDVVVNQVPERPAGGGELGAMRRRAIRRGPGALEQFPKG